jgi:membrane-associated phospholipid phosphatase
MTPTSPRAPSDDRAPTWGHVVPRLLAGLVLRWAVILGVLVVAGLAVTRVADQVWPFTVEDDLNTALEDGRTALGNDVSHWMSWLGNTGTIVSVCLVSAVVLRMVLKRWRESILVTAATLGQSLVFLATTLVIDRERPDVEKLDESPPTSSFPSGHTSAALALFLTLAVVVHRRVRNPWLRRALVVLLVCLPVLVAVGRLYRGMHHPSDIAGSLLNAGLQILLADRLLRATALPDDDDVPRHGVADGHDGTATAATTQGRRTGRVTA